MESCSVCHKQFKTRKCMLQHVKETHDKSMQRDCPGCSRSFSRPSNLRRHQKTCKGEQPSTSTTRDAKRKLPLPTISKKKIKVNHPTNHHVICSICGKGFTSLYIFHHLFAVTIILCSV